VTRGYVIGQTRKLWNGEIYISGVEFFGVFCPNISEVSIYKIFQILNQLQIVYFIHVTGASNILTLRRSLSLLSKVCAIKLCSRMYNETKELELNGDYMLTFPRNQEILGSYAERISLHRLVLSLLRYSRQISNYTSSSDISLNLSSATFPLG
jgi:hypothetical protein